MSKQIFSTLHGSNQTLEISNTKIFGSSNNIKGEHNIIHGSSNIITGNHNDIKGSSNIIKGEYNTIQGSSNCTYGYHNYCKGSNNINHTGIPDEDLTMTSEIHADKNWQDQPFTTTTITTDSNGDTKTTTSTFSIPRGGIQNVSNVVIESNNRGNNNFDDNPNLETQVRAKKTIQKKQHSKPQTRSNTSNTQNAINDMTRSIVNNFFNGTITTIPSQASYNPSSVTRNVFLPTATITVANGGGQTNIQRSIVGNYNDVYQQAQRIVHFDTSTPRQQHPPPSVLSTSEPAATSIRQQLSGIKDQKANASEKTSIGQESNVCTICMENEIKVVLIPCGHARFCASCVSQLLDKKICPLCKVEFISAQVLYL